MYGIGMAKGFAVTMRNFLRTPTTIQYPDRAVGVFHLAKKAGLPPPLFLFRHPKRALAAMLGLVREETRVSQHPRFRGEEFGWFEERCTGCASCAKFCPLGIIRIETHPSGAYMEEGESYAIDTFDIDIGRCMFCGLCVEACPYDALFMGSGFERGRYTRSSLVIPVEELRTAEKRLSTWFRPQLEQQQYNPTESEAVWTEAGREGNQWHPKRPSEQDEDEDLRTTAQGAP